MRSTWTTATATTTGLGHRRRQEPCEDASASGTVAGWSWVAVADGHGSPRCPRAHRGAALAVQPGAALAELPTGEQEHELRRFVRDLPGLLTAAWCAGVAAELVEQPLTASERALVGDGPAARAFGSTLVFAAACRRWIVLAQIGDGDVLTCRRDRRGARRPIPPVEGLARNATHSLSQPGAAERFRTSVIDLAAAGPEVVFLATDGFGNAFAAPEWHEETAAQLIDAISSDPTLDLDLQLREWAGPPAEVGGDDVSLALLVAPELRAAPGPVERTPT